MGRLLGWLNTEIMCVMQKTINKIWIVLTLGMLCILIFCAYANGALKRSQAAVEKTSALEIHIALLSSTVKALEMRLSKLETSISSLQEELVATNSANWATPVHPDALHALPEGARVPANETGKPIAHAREVADRNTADSRLRTHDQTEAPVLSIAAQQLEAFRNSLSKAQLIELTNRIEDALVGSFDHAATIARLSDQQRVKFIELIGKEQLESLRRAQEESVLMRMMSEHIQQKLHEKDF